MSGEASGWIGQRPGERLGESRDAPCQLSARRDASMAGAEKFPAVLPASLPRMMPQDLSHNETARPLGRAGPTFRLAFGALKRAKEFRELIPWSDHTMRV
ncbi:MAG: hypothetical protein CMP81_19950 [Fulvimarina sp.]|nr:hypothetical protein [Fulvimarina sp.]